VPSLLVAIVIVAGIISRPVAVRRWRAGRVGDRTLALAGLSRFPLVTLAFGVIIGASPPLLLLVAAGSVAVAALFYRPMLGFIRDERNGDWRSA